MSQVRRRQLLLALGAGSLLASLPIFAQRDKRVRRIGFLAISTAQAQAPLLSAFRAGMVELQWVEERDYVIDAQYANGIPVAGPGLADKLVTSQPDLLLTTAEEAVALLTKRTKTIPIVFAIAQDPVGSGFAESLRRPGGNATGLTTLARELSSKRLQLLKETFPSVTHVALLFEPANSGSFSQVKDTEVAAARLALRVSSFPLRHAADLEAAFKRGAALGTQAYIFTQGGFIATHRQAVLDLAARFRVPSFFTTIPSVEAGGLLSYAPSPEDNYRRAATYVDKILKGAKPGDLPIEQPTKFEMVVNMKTAKAMGFDIPQSVLLRADRVIE